MLEKETLSPDNEVANQATSNLYEPMLDVLSTLGVDEVQRRYAEARHRASAEAFTFLLDPFQYRPTPLDLLPRIISSHDWEVISRGVAQRLRAINSLLFDVYCGRQSIIPLEVLYTCERYGLDLHGIRPRKDTFVHVYGIDLVRTADGQWTILEDNLRIPSGISYQLKLLELADDLLPEVKQHYAIQPYEIRGAYHDLFDSLATTDSPTTAILTDGKRGSAYFEHRYLSELLGVPLVEGTDLHRDPDGRIRAQTVDGDFPLDVIYRRVENLEMFVRGLDQAYRDGTVALANSLGNGAGDDKLVFLWIPDAIRHYLREEPVLQQAKSYDLLTPENRQFVLSNLGDLVLKSRGGYGGLGVYILKDLGDTYRVRLAQQIMEQPEMFIAQETLDFSRHVVFSPETNDFSERYVDLRVYAIQDGHGNVTVFPGGLTRVSQEHTRITNNSSGGMCKPTWVLQ